MQKISVLFFSFIIAISFSSCFVGEEKIVIKEDNSGTYTFNIDMSELLKMAKNMGKGDDIKKEFPKKMDTIIYLRSYADTSTKLNAKEKEMLKDGWVHMSVDENNDEMKIEMKGDFHKLDDLSFIKENLMKAIDKTGAMDAVGKKKKEGEEKDPAEPKPQEEKNPFSEGYTYTVKDGRISYAVTDNKKLEASVQSDSAKMMMGMISQLMGDASIKSTYTLPRPVKNYKGTGAVLSADKKTVSFTVSFKDLLDDPKLLQYDIEY